MSYEFTEAPAGSRPADRSARGSVARRRTATRTCRGRHERLGAGTPRPGDRAVAGAGSGRSHTAGRPRAGAYPLPMRERRSSRRATVPGLRRTEPSWTARVERQRLGWFAPLRYRFPGLHALHASDPLPFHDLAFVLATSGVVLPGCEHGSVRGCSPAEPADFAVAGEPADRVRLRPAGSTSASVELASSVRIRTSAGGAGPWASSAPRSRSDANGDGALDGTDERGRVLPGARRPTICPMRASLRARATSSRCSRARTRAQIPASSSSPDRGKALTQTVGAARSRRSRTPPQHVLRREARCADAARCRHAGAAPARGAHLGSVKISEPRVLRGRSEAPDGHAAGFPRAAQPARGSRDARGGRGRVRSDPSGPRPRTSRRLRLSSSARRSMHPGWRALETRAELLRTAALPSRQCGSSAQRVPPGGLRARPDRGGFRDTRRRGDVRAARHFRVAEVETVDVSRAWIPPGAVADEIPRGVRLRPQARSRSRIHRATRRRAGDLGAGRAARRATHFALPELSDFDWVVRQTLVVQHDRDCDPWRPGRRRAVQNTSGGFVMVRNLSVDQNGTARRPGPEPDGGACHGHGHTIHGRSWRARPTASLRPARSEQSGSPEVRRGLEPAEA